MTMREIMLAIQGHEEQQQITDDIYRRMTFIIAMSGFNGNYVGKKFNKLWPSEQTSKQDVAGKAKETIRKMRERQAIERANNKLNGRRS